MAARKQKRGSIPSQPSDAKQDTKICASCGRVFGYQKRWERTWESVRYCSASCRQDKFEKRDKEIEESILQLLSSQPKQQSSDLSEIETTFDTKNFKNFKERSRRAARRLVAQGKIDILQKGRVVDASTAKGPIEVKLK